MSIFNSPAVLENGTYRFDIGGGRFVRATPDPYKHDWFFVRYIADGEPVFKGEMNATSVDFIVKAVTAKVAVDNLIFRNLMEALT